VVRLLAKASGSGRRTAPSDVALSGDAAEDTPAPAGGGATEEDASAAVREVEAQATELEVELHHRQVASTDQALPSDAFQGAAADAPEDKSSDVSKTGAEPKDEHPSKAASSSSKGGEHQEEAPVEEDPHKPEGQDDAEDALDDEIQEQLAADEKHTSQPGAAAEEALEEPGAPPQEAAHAEEPAAPMGEDRLRRRKVGQLQGSIARETGSPGLAAMLAGLKMDLFRLRDKVDGLERTIQDGVRLQAVPPDERMIYPLSACMRCILVLTGLYFLVYTSAGVSRVFTDVFSLGADAKTELSLRAACDTVFYAPMICVLFLGAHLRAEQITEGEAGPGEATELAMEACTCCLIAQTLLVLLVPVLTGEAVRVDEEAGLELPVIQDAALAAVLELARYAAMAGLYLGIAVVCAEAVLMDTRSLGVQPVDRWDDPTTAAIEYAPPVSAAMRCTMALTCLFFAVHLVRAALRSCLELSGGVGGAELAGREGHRSGARELVAHWERCLQVCAHATSPSPMLCILFMAARMRALQLDPKSGRPEGWAELCFYESSAAVAVHAATIFLAKAFGVRTGAGPRAGAGGSGGDLGGGEETPLAERLVFLVRIIAVLLVCWGFLGVISSMFLIEAPSGQPSARPSPAMFCAFAFAGQYFAVYACTFLSQAFAVTSSSLGVASEGNAYLLQTVHALQVAEYSVKLCPMLAVLFVGAWMRSQLIRELRGSVQCWARDAMYVAVTALLAQLLLALASRNGAGPSAAVPSSEKTRRVSRATVLAAAKASSFAVLYGSVAVVGFSVLAVRPETAVCEP